MKKSAWKRRIVEATIETGTFKPAFTHVIDTLAEVLELRDSAYTQFLESGGQACVEKVSDRGSRNLSKNPYLSVWDDLNRTALSYWRELGLSPAALKKASSETMEKQSDGFTLLLEKITEE